MNENNSKIVEYTLVILIGLIISYVIFAQQQADKVRFADLEKRIEAAEQKLDILKTDNAIEDLRLKKIDEKVNPKVEEPAVNPDGTLVQPEKKTEESTTTPTSSTTPTQPKVNPAK